MDIGALKRITVTADPAAFPYTQGYIEHASQRVWWDMRFLHQRLLKCGEGRVFILACLCCSPKKRFAMGSRRASCFRVAAQAC